MHNQLTIFSSNRVELLYEKLKQNLYSTNDFAFARRQIVVPNASMKAWLLLRLASDPDCMIAAGIEVCYLDHALKSFYLKSQNLESAYIPCEMELTFLIEAQLRQVLAKASDFEDSEKALWQPVFKYLKSQQRLISLSNRLAQLFLQYGRYGGCMLESWESSKNFPCWQAKLWQELKKQHPALSFLYQQLSKVLNKIESPAESSQLHLFALSFIPAQAHRFLAKAAYIMPIRYYLLSPCQVFWSDICSDKERVKLQQYWNKRGASESQQQTLDLFLRERNSLLANFGRMGREMAQQIDQDAAQVIDCYQLPAFIQYIPYYANELALDAVFDAGDEPPSLLHAVQADMALLRNPDSQFKIEMLPSDHSIQLHTSYTKYREVENLYNILLHLLTKHANDATPMTPADIIVMVPDLSAYEPTICSIFGANSSVLDFQLMETRLLAKNSLVQGFFHLIELASGRWSAEALLQLLEYPEFNRKQNLSQVEIQQIRTWIELSGAYWGQNPSHRDEMLARDHGNSCQQMDVNPAGTWEHSLKRLLISIAIEPAGFDDSNHIYVLPIEGMETSHAELLEKWLTLLRGMQRDLKSVYDGTCMDLKGWSSYLERLKDTYFCVDRNIKEAVLMEKSLTKHIQALVCSSRLKKERFSFPSVYCQLTKAIDAELTTYRETNLQAVRFCSLSPMRALPAKVIVLLGMSEEGFPRKETPISLNELISYPEADYAPTQIDFDRYLFLEALLSARRYFVLSYVGHSFEERREILPSLLVQELFSYLDEGYLVGDKIPSQHCLHRHPYDVFDKSYFEADARFPSYVPEHYRLAQAHYQKIKEPSHQFVNKFSIGAAKANEGEVALTIKELSAFAKDPLKAYFNKSLRIYLDKKEDSLIQSEESFALSHLERYQLRLEGMSSPLDTILNRADREGVMPRGLFRALASENLGSEIEKMHQNLAANQVAPQEIVPLHFLEHCQEPICDEKGIWHLPPILMQISDGCKVKIVGTIKDVSPQGLIIHQTRDLSSVFKVWPQYLLLCRAIELYQLPILPQLISSKHSKPIVLSTQANASQLKDYIEYYFLGLQAPSPLIPEWIPDFLKEDPVHFCKTMQSGLEGSFSTLYNDYALWLFREGGNLALAEELHAEWRPLSVKLFDGIKI